MAAVPAIKIGGKPLLRRRLPGFIGGYGRIGIGTRTVNGFLKATEADWLKRVETVLRGADFDSKLVSRSADGIRIAPLYPRRQGARPVVGARGASRWRVAQRIDHPDFTEAAALALAGLEGGADQLVLTFEGNRNARGFGLRPDDLHEALGAAMIDLIALSIEPGPDAAIAANAVIRLCEKRGLEPKEPAIDFGFAVAADGILASIQRLQKAGFTGPFIACDARPAHEAGASEAQELAVLLAEGVAALRLLEKAGIAPDAARRMLSFVVPVDQDQLFGIAKLRAVRILWARVEEALGVSPAPVRIRAETSWRMLTRRDAHANILRGTIACFAAATGGADAINVLPFTAALGLADAQARRLERNTQLVLMEEASLWRVVDPAAGSGAIEAFTDGLCEKAWSAFQVIERAGGIAASVKSGAFPAQVDTMRIERFKAVATRRMALTGITEFPDLAEAVPEVLMPARAYDTGVFADLRLAAPFEILRDAAEATAAKTGARPRVLLATLGDASRHGPRRSFAESFFAAGGIECETAEALEIARRGGLAGRLVCLCGSDEAYAAEAAGVAAALARAGARVWLAGRPGAHEAELAAAGISRFIFAGCDVVEALRVATAA